MSIQQDSSHPTGVRGSDTSKTELAVARGRKSDAALALRAQNYEWSEIARLLGYPSGKHALVATEQALKRKLTEFDKEQLRGLASVRLESLISSVWTKAHDETSPEQLAAVGKAREVISDWSRLWGLNAPTEVLVATPTQAELDQWVGRIISHQMPSVVEADIVDGDIVEDDPDAVA